jgi:hypothetical protein
LVAAVAASEAAVPVASEAAAVLRSKAAVPVTDRNKVAAVAVTVAAVCNAHFRKEVARMARRHLRRSFQ